MVMSGISRFATAALCAAVFACTTLPTLAQDAKPGDKPPTASEAAKEAQRQRDEFVEASKAVTGPAGNAECEIGRAHV